VSAVGSDVRDVKVGDRVAYTMSLGSYADMLPCRREAGEDSSWSKRSRCCGGDAPGE